MLKQIIKVKSGGEILGVKFVYNCRYGTKKE